VQSGNGLVDSELPTAKRQTSTNSHRFSCLESRKFCKL